MSKTDRIIIAAMLGTMVLLPMMGAALYFLARADYSDDAPYELVFSPQVSGNSVYIDAKTVKMLGASSTVYPLSALDSLPEVYLYANGQEIRLGKFEYG